MSDVYNEKVAPFEKLLSNAKANHSLALTTLCMTTIIKTMACKRFRNTVRDNTAPPQNLLSSLSQALKIAKENSLDIPGSLQAKVLKFVPAPAA